PKTGRYTLTISIITPYLQLANDGKTPALACLSRPIAEVVKKAANAAYRAMAKPFRPISIKDAAWNIMESAYLMASDGGKLPANPGQDMYEARPQILKASGAENLGDAYFTQTLLPDFMETNPDRCADWDLAWDARGHFTEPHTRRSEPLGTIEVREY